MVYNECLLKQVILINCNITYTFISYGKTVLTSSMWVFSTYNQLVDYLATNRDIFTNKDIFIYEIFISNNVFIYEDRIKFKLNNPLL